MRAVMPLITKVVSIDNVAFTAVTPDRLSDGFAVRSKNGNPIVTRSDPANPSTEDTLPAGGAQKGVAAVAAAGGGGAYAYGRFPAGQPVIHVKATVPSDQVIADFVEVAP